MTDHESNIRRSSEGNATGWKTMQDEIDRLTAEVSELRTAITKMRRKAGKGSAIDNIGKFAMKRVSGRGSP